MQKVDFPQMVSFSFCQSSSSDSRGVGSGATAAETVPPGAAQQVAADFAVVRGSSWPGVRRCLVDKFPR